MKNYIFINYLLALIIISSFIFGLTLSENSSGGAENDSIAILNNANIFNTHILRDIPWDIYKSTSLPLFYIINKILFNDIEFIDLVTTNIFLSIFIFFFFYLTLKKKMSGNKIENSSLLLLSSIVLLSPYLRSSTFWGLEEIIGVFFFVLSLFFYEKYNSNKNFSNQILCLLAASLAVLSRQSYIFLIIFYCYEFFNFKKIFDKKNILIFFALLIFNLPMLYFFYIWNGLLPPMAQDQRGLSISLVNLPFILSILFIYFVPTMLLNFKDLFDLVKFIKKKYIYIFLSSAFFLIIVFFSDLSTIGGGALTKIIYFFNLNKFLLSLILSIFSGTFLIYLISFFEKKILILFLLIILVFSTIDIVFQEYFDPITFIAINILFLSKSIETKKIFNYIYFSVSYYTIFLIGSYFYYNL